MAVRDKLLVLAAYALLTVFLTYPLASEFSAAVAGGGVVWQNVWNLWWVKKAVTELKTTPYHTDYFFHPTGVSLSYHTLTLFNSLFAIPLQAFFTLTESYNILVYFSFVLAGYGAYLLADYVLSDKKIAFVCGFIYAFSPYHVHEVWSGALHLATIQWIPFFVLYLLKTLSEGGRNAFYAGFFLFLVSLSEWQYMGITIVYALFTIAYQLQWRAPGVKAVLKDLAVMFSTFILLIAPYAYPLVRDFLSADYMLYSPLVFLGVSQSYSLDLTSPLIPNFMNTFFGEKVMRAMRDYGRPPYDSLISAGYVVLGLALLPAARKFSDWIKSGRRGDWEYFNKRTLSLTVAVLLVFVVFVYLPFEEFLNTNELNIAFMLYILISIVPYALARRSMGFWSASAVLFFLLSLGPGLKILGRDYPFPLPYFFSVILPPFRIFRAPYRFYVIVTLALAILAGKSLKEEASRRKNPTLFIFLALSLILLEYAAVPFPVSSAAIPQAYEQIKADEGDFAVLEVPVMPVFLENNNTQYMVVYAEPEYYQTYHEKKLVGGYVSRYPREQLRFLEETPFLRELRLVEGSLGYRPEDAAAFLKKYNIKYVILHREFYDNTSASAIEGMLNDTLGDKVTYDNGLIVAYKTF